MTAGVQGLNYGSARGYGVGTGDGSTAANAGASALAIKQRTGTTVNGRYWVKPPNGPAALVYCDMQTAGGGWMLIARTHPSASPAAGTFGWRATSVYGAYDGYGSAYCLDLLNWYTNGFKFHSYLYGNQLDVVSNNWGPFVYMVGIYNCDELMTSDVQINRASGVVVSNNSNVWAYPGYPGMQNVIGFCSQGTANNVFYMRDCCGFAGYGITAAGMSTTYCGIAAGQAQDSLAGPFCNGATLSGNNWVQGSGGVSGTNQCLLMVR